MNNVRDLDELVPHFRLAAERWEDAPTLEEHYKAVRESYEGTKLGLIATVRSFVECVCLTILGEFGHSTVGATPTTTELLVEALKSLGLQNDPGGSKVSKLLSAHNKLADALTEIRNERDPVAHGRDGFVDVLSVNEGRAFLLTADAIVALLLAAHDGTEPDLQYTRYPYDRFAHLHERIDQSVAVAASMADDEQTIIVDVRTPSLNEGIQLRIEPSRLLYAIDRSAYVEVLSSSAAHLLELPEEVVEDGAGEVRPGSITAATTASTPIVTATYVGRLKELEGPLSARLDALGVLAPDGLVDSLLATAEEHAGLDWVEREQLIAAMVIALKRVLLRFGFTREAADKVARETVAWLREQDTGQDL